VGQTDKVLEMNWLDKELDKATELRKSGNHKESNELLMKLVQEYPENASINYQCAWSFDLLGEESKAVPFYENAIKLGLSSNELEGALLGLGSTYRTLGEYEKSKRTFQKGIESFPNNRAIQTFYSMTLYNLNEHSEAMELLLKCLVDTTTDDKILSYKKAIDFYSNRLDEIWE
jgi:tetratricopeptide (TPR) repeat protein